MRYIFQRYRELGCAENASNLRLGGGAGWIRTAGVARRLSDRKPARALEKFRIEIDQHRPENSFAPGFGRVQSSTFKFRCHENAAGLTAMDREPWPCDLSLAPPQRRGHGHCTRGRHLLSSSKWRGSICGFRELWDVTTPCRVRDRESLSSQMSGGATHQPPSRMPKNYWGVEQLEGDGAKREQIDERDRTGPTVEPLDEAAHFASGHHLRPSHCSPPLPTCGRCCC